MFMLVKRDQVKEKSRAEQQTAARSAGFKGDV
jgi:hypothetical protein